MTFQWKIVPSYLFEDTGYEAYYLYTNIVAILEKKPKKVVLC